LRDDYERFTKLNAEILAISAESAGASEAYLRAHPLPFPTLVDEDHATFDAYDATSRLMSLGQRPALYVVDGEGTIRFEEIGAQQWNIPSNDQVVTVLESL
jgi:peroxiredoxin